MANDLSQAAALFGVAVVSHGLANARGPETQILNRHERLSVGAVKERNMVTKSYNVLFICTGNSARSIIAEVVLNRLGKGHFTAFSAGSHPRGEIHPLTRAVLTRQGYDVSGLRSKSWTEFTKPEAPRMDFIFTVCNHVAGEMCPAWPGQPITAHWGFPDPVAVIGTPEQRLKAFADVEFQITNRIRLFINLPMDKITRMSLHASLTELGRPRT